MRSAEMNLGDCGSGNDECEVNGSGSQTVHNAARDRTETN